MKLYDWNRIEKEVMNSLLTRQVIHGEKMTLARLHLRKGCIVPLHQHVNEQFTIVESGKLRFLVGNEQAVLATGEMVLVPSNTPHSVEALEDTSALDVHSPVRQDWLQGDDAYLRR
jgi:quercetin dioxygenase-like cupin family protein